jgi:tripartite-type tricarboxylate transporter receptor subunit TctC
MVRFCTLVRAMACTVAVMAFAAPSLHAQDYPTKPLTIMLGYAPGGAVDVPTRYFADKLTKLSGQPVLIENRPGAQTNVAAAAVARSAPDGYTLFIASGNATMASNQWLFKKLDFDPVKSFTPVTTLFKLPFVVVVSAKLPVNSMAELTAYLKKKGAAANYGYAGSFAQIASELYKTMAGLQALGIGYKMPQQSIPGLYSGEIDFLLQDPTNVINQVRAGKMKALAVTPRDGSTLFPDLPSMHQAGYTGYNMLGWFGLYLPARAPAPVVERLANWFNQVVKEDETRAFLAKVGSEPFIGNAKLLADFQAEETEKWGRLIKAAGIQPE